MCLNDQKANLRELEDMVAIIVRLSRRGAISGHNH